MNKNFFDKQTVNISALAVLSFVEALQVLIIVALIFSFIPFKIPAFVQKLYPLSLYDVRIERESLFYHVWIAAGLLLQGLFIFSQGRLGCLLRIYRTLKHNYNTIYLLFKSGYPDNFI